jgi:alanine racemase
VTTPREISKHPAAAWIDLDRIRDNFRALRTYAGAAAVIPVLKANAYGHGAITVARALEPLSPAMFAVAYVDEGIALRKAGIRTPILILTGFAPDQWHDLVTHELTPVVSTPEQVALIESLPGVEDSPQTVHVKVDTGMSRLGFSLQELERAVHRLEDSENVRIEGLMTHLAAADEDQIATARQLDLFDEAIVRLQTLGVRPPLIHAANSAGLSSIRESHTAVRPGLLLYGVRPAPLTPDIDVQPAMEVRARVSLVKTVGDGTPVSYGGRYVARGDQRIATVNIGYADGVPRTAAMRERGFMVSGTTRVPVAGTVCMDLTMLDLAPAPDVAIGDEVTVLGESPSAWEVSEWAGTNAWQTLTAIGPRIPRRYRLSGREVNEDLVSLA